MRTIKRLDNKDDELNKISIEIYKRISKSDEDIAEAIQELENIRGGL